MAAAPHRDPDFLALALGEPVAAFVAACPFPFLLGNEALSDLPGPRLTLAIPVGRSEEEVTDVGVDDVTALVPRAAPPSMIFAVRKVQREFPAMITVGRSTSNDVAIRDAQVSKFHAFFQSGPAGFQLSDAGSRNGTWIDGRRLMPSPTWTSTSVTPGGLVRSGAAVRLATLQFVFVDAAECWKRLRARAK